MTAPVLPAISRASKLLLSLFVLDGLVILLHLLYGHSNIFFHLDYEMNLPTLYQGIKLIITGLIMLRLVVARRFSFYVPLSLILIYLGIDEIFVLHESYEMMIYATLPELWQSIEVFAEVIHYNSSRWVLYLLPVIVAVFVYISYISAYTKKRLPQQFPFFMVGFFLFALVIIFEILNSAPGLTWREHQVLIAFEEAAEMVGGSFFAFFTYGLSQLKPRQRKTKKSGPAARNLKAIID